MYAKRYHFTLVDVATNSGYSLSKVYRDVRNHVFDPTSLTSVVIYIHEATKPKPVE